MKQNHCFKCSNSDIFFHTLYLSIKSHYPSGNNKKSYDNYYTDSDFNRLS